MAKVKIKPIGDRVLVKHLEEKEQVRGGILIPDSAKEKPQEAEVIALGTGKKDEDGKLLPFEVKVGEAFMDLPFESMRTGQRARRLPALASAALSFFNGPPTGQKAASRLCSVPSRLSSARL